MTGPACGRTAAATSSATASAAKPASTPLSAPSGTPGQLGRTRWSFASFLTGGIRFCPPGGLVPDLIRWKKLQDQSAPHTATDYRLGADAYCVHRCTWGGTGVAGGRARTGPHRPAADGHQAKGSCRPGEITTAHQQRRRCGCGTARSSRVRRSPPCTEDGRTATRRRGWNRNDPLIDTYRALSELPQIAGPVPVVLIGHSMGGRAALRAASHPRVRGVLALAPWLPTGEPTAQLSGKTAVVVHGERDRVTRPRASADYVRRARTDRARIGMIVIRKGDHAMARRSSLWHRTVATVVTDLLHPKVPPRGRAAAGCSATDPLLL
ncbi:alpha/beta hydrolase [Streptomyces albogriseolus]